MKQPLPHGNPLRFHVSDFLPNVTLVTLLVLKTFLEKRSRGLTSPPSSGVCGRRKQEGGRSGPYACPASTPAGPSPAGDGSKPALCAVTGDVRVHLLQQPAPRLVDTPPQGPHSAPVHGHGGGATSAPQGKLCAPDPHAPPNPPPGSQVPAQGLPQRPHQAWSP